MLAACLVAATLVLLAQAPGTAAPPATLTQIDTGKLKGTPSQLAWSPDGSELYLQTAERDSDGRFKKPRSFVIATSDPTPRAVENAPAWATEYWNWKSYKLPPNAEAPEIRVTQEMRSRLATESAMGGSVNEGGGSIQGVGDGSTSIGAVATRAQQEGKVPAVILKLKEETVGEFVGVPPVPGYTFGWAPKMPARLAYRTEAGHLAIIDGQGKKHEIAGTKNVILPAWSPDDTKIAFLVQTGKNKYDLCVVQAF